MMDDLEAPSPPVVFGGDVTPSRTRSGHEQTRQRNSLPAIFLLYSRQDEYLVGAAVFTDVYRLAQGDPDAFWLATRGVELEFPIAVTKSMCQYQSTVFTLKRDVETRVRQSMSTVGDVMLATHYPEFESKRFRCFTTDLQTCKNLLASSSGSLYLRSPASYLLTAGVVATVVPRLPVLELDEVEDS